MSVLEKAPPEAEEMPIYGEVPANTTEIGDALFDDTIRGFVNRARKLREALGDDQELVVQIPSQESAVPHTVPLEELSITRDKENRRFFATFKETVKNKPGEHKVRDATIALSVSAALLVAGSLYYRHKK